MALQLVTPVTVEPITLADARAHLKPSGRESNDLIEILVKMAREMAEQETGRALAPQTWRKTLDEFPDQIRLDNPPIVSVTSVKYYDVNGVQQTLSTDSYILDTETEPGWLVPAYNFVWPVTQRRANAVQVIYTCGYATPDNVPSAIKNWMLLQMRAAYDNPAGYSTERGFTMLPQVDRMLDRYRVSRCL